MNGDIYQVFYCKFEKEYHTYESELGRFSTWKEAKDERDRIFFTFGNVKAVWVMKINPGLNLVSQKLGATLRRNKEKVQ